MTTIIEFLKSDVFYAFSVTIGFFLFTLYLASKKLISFFVSFFLLCFGLLLGIVISNQQLFQLYVNEYQQNHLIVEQEDSHFKKQITQAAQNIKKEVSTEKENLQQIVDQFDEIFDQMDKQKQKLQEFIEETKNRFNTEDNTEG